jgi:glycosyltransferase involved in cell wall biosynthesis
MVVRGVTMLHNNCDYVIAPSRKIEKQLHSWHTKAPVRVLPTGVDKITTNSRAISIHRAKYDLLPSDKVVLFVGRLGAEKNIELLLSAFAITADEVPQSKLMIVGRHEHQTKLERLALELGISDRVIFTGYIEHHKLGAVYESASLFAFTSRTDTQGLVLHEAATAGLPIVMIDKDITEVVKDGVNGFFARNSARDFAKKMTEILSNDLMRESMGIASAKLAKKYSPAHQVLLLEKLYQNSLDARQRALELPQSSAQK